MHLDKDTVAFQKGQSKFHVDYLAIFGSTSAKLVDMYVDPAIDFGIGRLENYSPIPRHQYPVFRQREVKQGELLCRVGYPFIEDMKPSWKNGKFTFGRLMPVPQFVNEALVSRFVKLNTGVFIETSSPGLQGQSGGPLADVNGFICGMQSHTRHYPLGFKGGGKNQVLNVGRAVHVETMKSVFDIQNISYSIERS